MSTETPINRRQMLVLVAAAAAAGTVGCEPEVAVEQPTTNPASAEPATRPTGVIDVGLLDNYNAAQVYDDRGAEGFFVIRSGGEVFALSAVCTHKGCLVHAQSDGSFKCKCHGSRFSPQGTVLNGPAQRDLPRLAVRLDERRHVLVDKNRPIDEGV